MTQILSYPCSALEAERHWQSARMPFAQFLREKRGDPAVRANLAEMFGTAVAPQRQSERA